MKKVLSRRVTWFSGVLLSSGLAALIFLSATAGPGGGAIGQTPAEPWEMILFGGPGNQWGCSIAIRNDRLFAGGIDWDIHHGRLRSFALPLEAAYQWDIPEWGKVPYGLTPTASHLFVAGDAQPPACGAYDCMGGSEGKVTLSRYSLSGGLEGCWTRNFFPYCGGEHYHASALSTEGGIDYIYAAGWGEQWGWLRSLPFLLTKYTTAGVMINKVMEPELSWDWYYPPYNVGGSSAYGITILNGYIYLAGGSRLSGLGEDWGIWNWGTRPMVMKYDFNLIRQWKVRSNIHLPYPGYSGWFQGITSLDGYLYAVGGAIPTGGEGGLDYLIEKYDELGNRVWSESWGEPFDDILKGVVAVGNRLFAVGYRHETSDPSETTGEADAVLFEIDPANGACLMSAVFGGDRFDQAVAVSTDGRDLYILGNTRSYDSSEGNSVGQSEIMLIHYPLNHAPIADDQSIDANAGVPVDITLTASDEDDDDLAYSIVSGPSHASLTGDAPNLVYTAEAAYYGPDEFTFSVNDGTEDSNVATVTIAVNHVPVADGQTASTDENVPLTIPLGSSTDVDGDPLTYTVLSGPAHGSIEMFGEQAVYTPTEFYYGPDSFTFQANESKANSNIATVSITVRRVFTFTGFMSPVDNQPAVNSAKAGSTLPVKWLITDLDGTPISDMGSFTSLTSYSVNCESMGDAPEEEVIEVYAGTSGLQYIGDGLWQFNWKTPKSYAGQCRVMVLKMADGGAHSAHFRFQ
jgi:hypothetical protein